MYPCCSVIRSFSSLLRRWFTTITVSPWVAHLPPGKITTLLLLLPPQRLNRVDWALPCLLLTDSNIPLWEFGADRRMMIVSKRERRETVSWYHNLQVERGEVIESSDRSVCALDMATRHGSFLTQTGIVIGNGWRVDWKTRYNATLRNK